LLDGTAHDVFAQPDILTAAGVAPPPLAQLAQRLGWHEMPFTVEAFVEEFVRRAGQRE
jgi:energy-coupling factor transport system ATP-binding protein